MFGDTLPKRATRDNADEFIARRVKFKTGGALAGYPIGSDPYNGTYGRLPEEFRESCRWADYRVYSYATPIAWWTDGKGWTIPDVTYSVTTTRHQHKARMGQHWDKVRNCDHQSRSKVNGYMLKCDDCGHVVMESQEMTPTHD